MVSARLAIEAQQTTPRNEELWQASDFKQIEQYINETLGDLTRIRQKLETPLQIVRNATTVASARVREHQNALADFRRSSQNVRSQIEAATREQQATVRQIIEEVNSTFAEAITRGREAIADIFQFSKILSTAIGSLIELLGLARLIRRFGAGTPAQKALKHTRSTSRWTGFLGLLTRFGRVLKAVM